MPCLLFTPSQTEIEVKEGTKILAAAIKSKVNIRYGCASCQCGTCPIKVSGDGKLTAMEEEEHNLLQTLGLSTAGDVRLACRAKILEGKIAVDIAFQDSY